MDKNAEELLERLAQLPPAERKRILNAFLESAIVVNREKEELLSVAEEVKMSEMEKKDYSPEYSEAGFRNKVIKYGKAIGGELLCQAFLLKKVLGKDEVPREAKLAIIGALGYLICPIDAIPDIIPVAGYTDDAAAVLAAYKMIQVYVTDEDRAEAETSVAKLLG